MVKAICSIAAKLTNAKNRKFISGKEVPVFRQIANVQTQANKIPYTNRLKLAPNSPVRGINIL